MFPPERFDPRAPGVVKMPGDHAHRAPRRSRNGGIPECGGQLLDEICSDPAVGSPGGQERRAEIGGAIISTSERAGSPPRARRNAGGADPPPIRRRWRFRHLVQRRHAREAAHRSQCRSRSTRLSRPETRRRDRPDSRHRNLSPGQSEMPAVMIPMATPTTAPMIAPLRSESPRF